MVGVLYKVIKEVYIVAHQVFMLPSFYSGFSLSDFREYLIQYFHSF